MVPTPAQAATLDDEQRYFDHAYEQRERSRAIRAASPDAGADTKARASLKRSADDDETLGDPSTAAAFLRIDTADGNCFYVGHAGIRDEQKDPLVYSWKARFINGLRSATHADPKDVVRNRSYSTSPVNRLDSYSDMVFAELAERIAALDDPGLAVVEQDEYLQDALDRERTPEMTHIVETIQAAQSDLIAADADQLLVIQGGPGTGKTAVALHRASALIFNDSITPEDLLVIGPNPTFTRYIANVLPELGDQHVRQTDIGRLLDVNVTVTAKDDARTARLKGDDRMVPVLSKGLRDRVRVPDDDLTFTVSTVPWRARVGATAVAELVDQNADRPYAIGRARFRDALQAAAGADVRRHAKDDSRRIAGDPASLVMTSEIDNAVERVWPQLSPQAFLRDLFGSLERLVSAAEGSTITADDVQLLRRAAAPRLSDQPWSREDLVLLDQANAEINGDVSGYAHIVVDEAQDLSPMQWLAIRRRSARGAITVVGDIAQSTGLWARDTWDDVIETLRSPLPSRIAELEYGYRVPRSVMELAARLLPAAAPGLAAPTVVRDVEPGPQLHSVAPDADFAAAVLESVTKHSSLGRFVGIVCPDVRRAEVERLLSEAEMQWQDADAGRLGKAINLVSPVGSKGLEFDAVVVIDPAAIVDAGPRGERMLYIALTRTTKHLDVVYPAGTLPALLEDDVETDPAETNPVEPPVTTATTGSTAGAARPASASVDTSSMTPLLRQQVALVAQAVVEVLDGSGLRERFWPSVLAEVSAQLDPVLRRP